MATAQKVGPSEIRETQVCPTVAGSHVSNGQVSDHRAKMRALAEAMGGPCIVRDTDGNGYLLTVEALKFIPLSHEALNA
jgi:hypothetical protein